MLNELYDLAQCLQSANVSRTSWHKHFKPCPGGTATYLTLLDIKSDVVELQRIRDRQQITSMRKWEVENGVSFPGLNVLPLYEPQGGGAKALAGTLRKSLASKSPPGAEEVAKQIELLVTRSCSLWGSKELLRINKCVTTLATGVATKLGSPPSEYFAITELILRASRLTADVLHGHLSELLVSYIARSGADAADWFDILFFHSGQKPKRVSLVLELADRSHFPYPANHSRVQAWMNLQFQTVAERQPRNTDLSVEVNPDAYANPATLRQDTFPSVRLPVLGNVILRAMSKESPCQKRYGVADSDSCPVGQLSRQQMKDALEWIGDPERRERTWCDVSSLNGVTGLLFVYPSQRREVIPELAGLIVGLDADADPDGARFEACSSRVTQTLKGQPGQSSGEVRVFVLTKPDGFRTKVIYSSRYAVNRLLQSADEWQRCAGNTPRVRIRQFGPKKGDKPVWVDPFTPFPAEVVTCLNTTWQRSGTHAEPIGSFGISDGLSLLLERGPTLETIVVRAMRTVVANSLNLLLALRQSDYQGKVHSVGKKYAKHPLLLPSILGLLLAKLGRWKGDYMKGPPFLVGRLLSLADQLHIRYCHGVRKGHIPPQLVGNALMATALEQPAKALALLSQRMLPYQAWANTVREGENIGLTKYLLGHLGRVCAELKELELPTTCSDIDKAEMLLGYLAHAEKDNNTDAAPTTTIEGANA